MSVLNDVMLGLHSFLEYRNEWNGRTLDITHQMVSERRVREGCILVKDEYPDLAGYELSWDAKMMIRGAWHCIEITSEKPV